MTEQKKTYSSLVNRLEGDKIVWLIVLILILISIVCVFSSTSRLLEHGQTRIDMVWSQLKVVFAGLVVIWLMYKFGSVDALRKVSKWGYLLSLILLLFLIAGPRSGPIRSIFLNGSRRAISVFGKQVYVYEMVKVLMVLYISWAIDAIKNGGTWLSSRLVTAGYKWFGTSLAKDIIYLYFPFISVCVLTLSGSNTAALFVGFLMLLTIFVAGARVKEIAAMIMIGILGLSVCLGTYKISEGKYFNRIGTGISRLKKQSISQMEQTYLMAGNAKEKQAVLDDIRQPYSALIAIKEGGLLGKGPGQSTQRYVVPDISEDYMFSFIVEEYGILGAFIILVLYVTLLARGSLIARGCGNDIFAKSIVAGITMLISLQAFLHICVNVRIGLMTGQTLPLISHGKSAFLCFCVAFGVVLIVSKFSQRRNELEERKADPLINTDKQ